MESGNRQPLDISALSGRLLTQKISTVPTPNIGGNPGIKVSHMSTVPTPSNGGNPGIKDSSMSTVPHQVMVGTLESRIRLIHLYLSQQIGVRSSKTSQCGSANRPSVVPQGSPRVLVPF